MKQLSIFTIICVALTITNFTDYAQASGPSLFEDFEQAGNNFSNTIFTDIRTSFHGPNVFEASSLTSSVGAPNLSPPLPINVGGDIEGIYYMPNPPQYGGYSGYALMSNQNEWTNMSIDGYIGFGRLTGYGSQTGSFLLRSNDLSGYLASVHYNNESTGCLTVGQLINGLAHADYLSVTSVFFPIDWNNNIHLSVSAIGTEITAQAWEVSVVDGIVVESPIVLNPGATNEYNLTLVDNMFQSGTGGIRAFIASNNSVFFDDITVHEIPEPATILMLGIGTLALRRQHKLYSTLLYK